METKSQEEKLLEILTKPELKATEGVEESETAVEAIDDAFPELDEGVRKVLAKAMTAKMPTPEEIMQSQRIATHNAEVQAKRDARRARRAVRGKITGRSKKNRKKLNHG